VVVGDHDDGIRLDYSHAVIFAYAAGGCHTRRVAEGRGAVESGLWTSQRTTFNDWLSTYPPSARSRRSRGAEDTRSSSRVMLHFPFSPSRLCSRTIGILSEMSIQRMLRR
jgi:hypothetical protein